MPSVLSYPLYYTLINVFAMGHSMNQLKDRFNDYHASFGDVDVLGTFLDCHDVVSQSSHTHDIHHITSPMIFIMNTITIFIIYLLRTTYLLSLASYLSIAITNSTRMVWSPSSFPAAFPSSTTVQSSTSTAATSQTTAKTCGERATTRT